MIIDWGMGVKVQQDYLNLLGAYVDLAKIPVGISGILDRDLLAKKIRLYGDSHVITFPGGGFLEISYQQGEVPAYFRAVVEMGYPAVEVSDNFIELPASDKVEIIKRAREEFGLRVLGEVGKKEETSEPREMIRDIHNCLKAGAWKVLVEARELFQRGFREQLALELSASIPVEKLIFETPSTWSVGVRRPSL
jgi:phosphosulfolactate synthase